MKTEFTKAESELIEVVYNEYMSRQTTQETEEDIRAAVQGIWDMEFKTPPEVIVCDSPVACKKQSIADGHKNMTEYWSMWYVGYAAMYDFANRIDLEMDQEKLVPFLNWVRCCPFVLFDENTVYVSRKPAEIHFNDNDQLHNESGMSCEFADGWGIYSINGVAVDEQIVMRPETQTIQQIRDEQNEEVKRIRIERRGWDTYLAEIGAELVDERRNDIEGTREYLFKADDGMMALMCICPSTGKEFILETPPSTKTCREAQAWLSNGLSERIISAS